MIGRTGIMPIKDPEARRRYYRERYQKLHNGNGSQIVKATVPGPIPPPLVKRDRKFNWRGIFHRKEVWEMRYYDWIQIIMVGSIIPGFMTYWQLTHWAYPAFTDTLTWQAFVVGFWFFPLLVIFSIMYLVAWYQMRKHLGLKP